MVQTDHKPLVSVWKTSIVCNSPRLQRLLLRLSQYDVNIEYLKGKDNVIADALSRVSPQPAPKEGEDKFTCSQRKSPPILQELEISETQLQKTLLPAY